MQKTTYIATCSGGKDSTTMVDLLLRNKYPVDLIVFNDTLAEHTEMYDYIKKINDYWEQRYGIGITTLAPNKTPEDLFFKKVKLETSEYIGQVKGIVSPIMGFCEWRSEAKIRPLERYIKRHSIKNYKIYIGFTTDEASRANREDDNKLYPLIDNFRMSEQQCSEYLRDREMQNPLYRHFTRTGCAWCPAKSEQDKYMLWKHYPKVWEYMRDTEHKLKELEKQGEKVIYNNWHNGVSIEELEERFAWADKQKTLFALDDEPLKDCFCKI